MSKLITSPHKGLERSFFCVVIDIHPSRKIVAKVASDIYIVMDFKFIIPEYIEDYK